MAKFSHRETAGPEAADFTYLLRCELVVYATLSRHVAIVIGVCTEE